MQAHERDVSQAVAFEEEQGGEDELPMRRSGARQAA